MSAGLGLCLAPPQSIRDQSRRELWVTCSLINSDRRQAVLEMRSQVWQVGFGVAGKPGEGVSAPVRAGCARKWGGLGVTWGIRSVCVCACVCLWSLCLAQANEKRSEVQVVSGKVWDTTELSEQCEMGAE